MVQEWTAATESRLLLKAMRRAVTISDAGDGSDAATAGDQQLDPDV
jgi:hypothetical protein